MSDPVTVDGKCYERIHIIHNGDPGAGFSALITYGLNGARRAESKNWLPIVDFSGKATPHFYEPRYGENVWEYYFEPLAGVSSATLQAWLDAGEVTPDQIHRYTDEEVVDWHVNDAERITTFWVRDEIDDRCAWMDRKRRLGREYVGRYIRPKPHIIEKVDQLYDALIRPRFTFGVHIRGTDFSYARPTGPNEYFKAIEGRAEALGVTDYGVFLATDQSQFVTEFEARFPGRVVMCDAIRSTNDVAPFKFKNVSPYKKGEDVLIDILLLSRCRYLFKSASAVGEYAMWFNPALKCTDFALSSEFVSDKATFWIGAYLKLDVDKKGSLRVALLTCVRIVHQILENLRRRLARVRE